MQVLLKAMTPTKRAKFKQEISPQMKKMQTHLKMMMIAEQMQFKREITPNTTQRLIEALRMKKTKSPTNPLSRETSPHTDLTIAGPPPSRETGPHPNKSMKKLAQALKKRARYEAIQPTDIPHPNHSIERLAEALKRSTGTLRHEWPIEKLANVLKQYTKRENERPTRTYVERIRELIGPPE